MDQRWYAWKMTNWMDLIIYRITDTHKPKWARKQLYVVGDITRGVSKQKQQTTRQVFLRIATLSTTLVLIVPSSRVLRTKFHSVLHTFVIHLLPQPLDQPRVLKWRYF